jgi:glycosyltransferase involved in cell wall biosynthesis
MTKGSRVVIVTNIPRPYRRALFGVLRVQLAAVDLGLEVLYTSDPSKHVRRGGAHDGDDAADDTYVHGLSFRRGYEHVITVPVGLGRAIARRDPVCVVAAGFGPSSIASAIWCHSAKVPHLIYSGGWPGQEGDIGRLQLMLRRWLVRKAAAYVAYGTAAAHYLISIGAEPNRVFCAWNTVDLEGISSAAQAAAARRPEISPKYCLAGKNLLYVGSLVERKGVRELVSAALAAECDSEDWALHLVGGGPLTDELKARVRAAGREANFRFHGLRPEADVAELLGVVDGFILPTKREAWGLVINEAMACGVPVVASPCAGATRDLIEPGITGYVVEPHDIAGLAAMISQLVSDDPASKRVGQAGAEAVRAKASLGKAAEGFVSAVLCAIGMPQDG